MGAGDVSDSYWLLGPYFSKWVALPSLNTRGGISYCNLIFQVLLIFMEVCTCLNRDGGGIDVGGQRGGEQEGLGGIREGKLPLRCKINKQLLKT